MTAPNRGRLQGWAIGRSTVARGSPSTATLLPGGSAPALTAPTNLVAPSISGSAVQGDTLTASPGSWSGNPVPNLTYLWKRDGVSTGQTGTTYNLTLADVDTTITVTVTATNSQGSVSVTSGGVGPVIASQAPSFSVQPSISGSPVVGETLTGADGTYSGSPAPAVIARRWYSDGLSVGTGPTYVVDLSDEGNMITFEVVVENSEGQATGTSAAVGPVTNPPPPSGLDAPVLTQTSAAGTSPFTWDTALNMDQVAVGFYLVLEQASGLAPATITDISDPNYGHFVSPDQVITHQLTMQEVADAVSNGGVGNIDFTADGFLSWPGPGAMHIYVLRDDGAMSPVSNLLADTIVASVAEFVSTAGTQKRAEITLSPDNLSFQGSIGMGAWYGVAATIDGSPKSQWELSLDGLSSEGDHRIAMGMAVGGTAVASSRPGVNDSLGFIIQFNMANNTFDLFRNNAASNVQWFAPDANQVGDVMALETDTSGAAGTHSIKLYRVRSGTPTLIGSVTGQTLTGFSRAFVEMVSDVQGTANFGASAYAHTPDAGYDDIYG